MKKYVIIEGTYDYSKYTFKDLDKCNDCAIARTNIGGIKGKINKIHTSTKINSKVNLPCKQVWYKNYVKNIEVEKETEYVIIFSEGNRLSYDRKFVGWMKKHFNNAKTVFYFLNSAVQLSPKRIEYVNNMFDYIVSYDKADCEKYKWNYYYGVYCPSEDLEKSRINSDVFFIGRNKNRIRELKEAYNYFTSNGLKCDFYIIDVDKKDVDDCGIHYNTKLPYEEVLSKLKSSRILFEIVQDGQTGFTLRTYEAIAYKKMLVTNNMAIKDTRIYDAKNMLFFNKISDIDVKKLKEYKYKSNGISKADLSPKSFIKYVEELTNA